LQVIAVASAIIAAVFAVHASLQLIHVGTVERVERVPHVVVCLLSILACIELLRRARTTPHREDKVQNMWLKWFVLGLGLSLRPLVPAAAVVWAATFIFDALMLAGYLFERRAMAGDRTDDARL
jgi:FtsH-binding integral membrane protein